MDSVRKLLNVPSYHETYPRMCEVFTNQPVTIVLSSKNWKHEYQQTMLEVLWGFECFCSLLCHFLIVSSKRFCYYGSSFSSNVFVVMVETLTRGIYNSDTFSSVQT